MADGDDGGFRQLVPQHLHHRVLVLLVERRGRLVQEDPARPVQQRPREGEALLLAERQHAVPALLVVQPLRAARPGRTAPAPPSTPRRRNPSPGSGRTARRAACRAAGTGAAAGTSRWSGRARGCGRCPRATPRRGRGTGWTCRCRSRPGSAPVRRGGSPRRPGAPAACRPGWRRRRLAGTRRPRRPPRRRSSPRCRARIAGRRSRRRPGCPPARPRDPRARSSRRASGSCP